MRSNMFRDQVNSVTSWFGSWSTCEQTVVLYSLLKQIPPLHCRFLVQMLDQRINDNKEVQEQEEEANNPVYICNLGQQPKEKVIQELLSHLPLLHTGNTQAKNEYLKLIPTILSHSIDHRVFIEESRQLLSYSLIHPAITSDERSKFNRWLGHLDECFSNYHSPSQSQGQSDDCPTAPHPGDNGISLRHVNVSKQNVVGSGRLTQNGCYNNNMCLSNESLNMNGLEGHGGNYGNQGQSLQGGVPGKMPLQATMSAPANFNTRVPPSSSPSVSQPTSHHAPLRRMPSHAPPNSLPISRFPVSDWLNTHDAHLVQGPVRPASSLSDHAPLSPQSSTASSGSGSDTHQEVSAQPVRNTFMEEGSGMRDVPLWLKSLRLHKYSNLFQQMTYEEMMGLTDEWLEQQNVTKGARNKIIVSIKKLEERQDALQDLERDVLAGGSIKSCISEMKAMLNTPLKAFMRQGDAQESPTSPGPGVETDNSIQKGDIPGQFTKLMTKVCAQLLTSPYDDEGLNMYLQLIEKCINHEAFSQKQKKLFDSFKQQARKIWQPAPVKYNFDKKARPNGNYTFPMGMAYNTTRPIQRSGMGAPCGGMKTSPKPTAIGTQWSFGAKRSIVGGSMSSGHLPLHKNNSHNMALFSHPGMGEAPVKQPVTRTHSAPLRSHGLPFGSISVSEQSATDTEINARLDSLCRSVTEVALGGLDGNERGSAF